MSRLLLVVVSFTSLISAASAGTITGTILNLDGAEAERIEQFQVQAEVAGSVVARGNLIAPEFPFKYAITIPDGAVNPEDVRVTLRFKALGRDPVQLQNIPGKTTTNTDQIIDVVMPVTEHKCPPPCCRRTPKKCHLFRHKCR